MKSTPNEQLVLANGDILLKFQQSIPGCFTFFILEWNNIMFNHPEINFLIPKINFLLKFRQERYIKPYNCTWCETLYFENKKDICPVIFKFFSKDGSSIFHQAKCWKEAPQDEKDKYINMAREKKQEEKEKPYYLWDNVKVLVRMIHITDSDILFTV